MTMTTEFQLVDINKLVPYANNARTHNKEQILKLRSSLREFGFINPIIIDKNYNVIAGHGRLEAAKAEGMAEVPCVFVEHFTEVQKKAYILADNRMAVDAGWDDDLLAVEMEELQNLGFDLGLTGFDESEIADLFDTNSGDTVKDDDFDLTTALEKAAFVQRGDIWTVGRHKLMCGDATSAEDVSALMGDTKANLILTDPPYGVSFKSSSGLTIQNDSMKNEEFYNFLLASFKCMADHLEKGGAAYVFHADTEGLNFRKLRERPETVRVPIILVTAKTTELDKVKGLDIGADDYLTKPFGVMELISRVKALLRRSKSIQEDQILRLKNVTLDSEKRIVHVNDIPCELTFKEFELLKLLMINAGIVLRREVIMMDVWGTDYEGESRTLDMHIKTLRQKLGDAGNMIKTVRNVGYKME